MIAITLLASIKNMDNYQHNAKYAFYYLLSLAALVFTALSVGIIAFNIVDRSVVDAAYYYHGLNEGGLRFAISALFIAAPIFYFSVWLISRGFRLGELAKESAVRRWLTYFILFVSALVILGVLIGLINNFLSGELSWRFALKALITLLISGLIFAFYLWDIRQDILSGGGWVLKIFVGLSAVLVLAAFTSAWFFVESPREARARRLDQNVINNIYALEQAVNNYYSRYQELPQNLEEIKGQGILFDDSLLFDPENREPIVYQRVSEDKFEFCAFFRTGSAPTDRYASPYYSSGARKYDAGQQCLPGNLYTDIVPKSIY